MAAACTQGKRRQHGKPQGEVGDDQPEAREGQAGRLGVAERFVLPLRPDHAGGGKGPQFETDARRRSRDHEIRHPINSEKALQRLREITSKLKLTINEREDTNLPGPGRGVRLPGVPVRTDVFGENRPGTPGLPAIEEEHQAHG